MFLRVFKYFKGKCYINFDIRCAASNLKPAWAYSC